jgi:hypothetical protein
VKAARFIGLVVFLALGASACGGGGVSGPPPPPVRVTISWDANRDSGVNRAGGGYQVSIGGQAMIDVPYTAGPLAPTSAMTELPRGNYTVTVRAFAALDSQGGNSGNFSAPSQVLALNIP